MTEPPDTDSIDLEKLAELALAAPREDRARLERTIQLLCKARMTIEHSSRVVEQAEHQLERLEGRAQQRRHNHAILMARMRKILDHPPE